MAERRPASIDGARPALLIVTALAILDVTAGPSIVVAGIMAVGPCLAAITGTRRTVLAVGAYSIGLLVVLSWPDHIWWTTRQLASLLTLVGVTAVSAGAAARRERDEQTLRTAEVERVRASAVSAATTGFLSRVSHELRTPLNAVLGFSELLERDELTPSQREAIEQVRRAGHHLVALVDDVLDVTAIEAGRLTLSVEPVAVDEAVCTAVELTTTLAQTSAIALVAELDDVDGWHVRADTRRLCQILVNLLSNAVKFNRPGGSVTISAERDGAGGIAIAVTDTGPGIAAQDLAKLFVPFERLGAEAAGIEGSGMGLALSRGLAVAMGGSLRVDSSIGAGATFSVTLPETVAPTVEPPARVGSVADHQAPAVDAAPAGVLYIEDNRSNVRLVERILERRAGWHLTHAGGGAEGLRLALATRFELILLDQHLPDMEGLDVLRALRAEPDRADVPVVIVSADASPGQRECASAAGADGYLTKPFTIDDLLAVFDARAPAT